MTVGKFQGGGAFNVIPDSVTIGGTFRALLKESLLRLKQRIGEVNYTFRPVFGIAISSFFFWQFKVFY